MADCGAERERKVTIRNNHGENLVGILHNAASISLVIVCHGFQSSKPLCICKGKDAYNIPPCYLRIAWILRIMGESEGSFQYGNYYREVEDLRAVVQHFCEQKCIIKAIVGHSKDLVA